MKKIENKSSFSRKELKTFIPSIAFRTFFLHVQYPSAVKAELSFKHFESFYGFLFSRQWGGEDGRGREKTNDHRFPSTSHLISWSSGHSSVSKLPSKLMTMCLPGSFMAGSSVTARQWSSPSELSSSHGPIKNLINPDLLLFLQVRLPTLKKHLCFSIKMMSGLCHKRASFVHLYLFIFPFWSFQYKFKLIFSLQNQARILPLWIRTIKAVYIHGNTQLLVSSAPFLNFLSSLFSLSLHPSILLRQHSSSSLRLPFCALQLFPFWFPLPTCLSLITASSLLPHHIFSSSSSIDLLLKTFKTPLMICIQVWPSSTPGGFHHRLTCVNQTLLQGLTSDRTGSS